MSHTIRCDVIACNSCVTQQSECERCAARPTTSFIPFPIIKIMLVSCDATLLKRIRVITVMTSGTVSTLLHGIPHTERFIPCCVAPHRGVGGAFSSLLHSLALLSFIGSRTLPFLPFAGYAEITYTFIFALIRLIHWHYRMVCVASRTPRRPRIMFLACFSLSSAYCRLAQFDGGWLLDGRKKGTPARESGRGACGRYQRPDQMAYHNPRIKPLRNVD